MRKDRGLAATCDGQAAVEYLLALAGLFLAMAGTVALFRGQIGEYLDALFGVIGFPL
jgi:hypothetical protein